MRPRTWGTSAVLLIIVISLFLVARPVAAGADFTGPSILTVSRIPLAPLPGATVNITAVITDEYSLTSVNLTYNMNGGSLASAKMSLLRGDYLNGTFIGSVPGLPLNSNISYRVMAIDTLGYVTFSDYSNYTVKNDSSPPQIKSGPNVVSKYLVSFIMPWDPLNITVSLSDSGSGIKNVSLWYVFNPQSAWNFSSAQSAGMNLRSGNRYEGEYGCVLPSQPKGTEIEYYVLAHDLAGNRLDYSESNRARSVVIFTDPSWDITVAIDSIDYVKDEMNITVYFSFFLPCAYEPDSLNVDVYSTYMGASYLFGQASINHNPNTRFSYYGTFTSSVVPDGHPEFYPFDTYRLGLTFSLLFPAVTVPNIGNSLNGSRVRAYLRYPLDLRWNLSPLQMNASFDQQDLSISLSGVISQMRWATGIFSLLPVVLSFLMLGSTIFLSAKKQLAERLVVYLTLFVFALGFFGVITLPQPSGPHFNVIQLLMIALFADVVIFSVSSMASSHSKEESREDPHVVDEYDFAAIAVAVIFTTVFCAFSTPSGPIFLFNQSLPALITWALISAFISVGLIHDISCYLGGRAHSSRRRQNSRKRKPATSKVKRAKTPVLDDAV